MFWQIEKARQDGQVLYLFYIQNEGEEFYINLFIKLYWNLIYFLL